ncbi:MAG: hypothetical protein ABIL77_04885 [candidate division WOR-3 bacterium]
MFIKTLFKKFKQFPTTTMGIKWGTITEGKLITSTSPPAFIMWLKDKPKPLPNNLIALIPKDKVYVLQAKINSSDKSVSGCVKRLNSNKERFIIEYMVFELFVREKMSQYLVKEFSEEFNSFKEDVIDIFKGYSVSEKLIKQISDEEIVIPLALVDIVGHLGYQLFLCTGKTSKLLVGVQNSGMSFTWSDTFPKRYWGPLFPWKNTFESVCVYDTDHYLFPFLAFNALLGITPIHTYIKSDYFGGTLAGQYLSTLMSERTPVQLLTSLSIAKNFKHYIYEILPNETINKLRTGATLSQEELDSISKFLEIFSTFFHFKRNIEGKAQDYTWFGRVEEFLLSLGLKELTASKLPPQILSEYNLKNRYMRDSVFEKRGMVIVASYQNKVYVIGPKYRNLFGFRIDRVNLKPLRDELLDLIYSYD